LSKQHQFKDDFLESIMGEIDELERFIQQNLVMLMGGVDQTGAYIFEVSQNEVTGHNNIGYATIGSGLQPARSEFINTEYGPSSDLETAAATAAAAHKRAKQARGVGGDLDIGVVAPGRTDIADDATTTALTDRQDEIDREQKEAKENILTEDTIDWDSRP
jgi:hypothetical protein